MKSSRKFSLAALCLIPTLAAGAALSTGAEFDVQIHRVSDQGIGDPIGTVRIAEHSDGVLLEPELRGLEPGLHGFHLHENPSCDPAKKKGKPKPAGAAGGHLNPDSKGDHNGPFADGHLGDLPALYVNAAGVATLPVLAPRLQFAEVPGHALVIHSGGDNYASEPKPMGGGGQRVACGVVVAD